MKIAFISSIMHFPWGGADTLWTRAAEEAIERGDFIFAAISPLTAAHPRIRALGERGAALFLRSLAADHAPRHVRLAQRLRTKFNPNPLLNALERYQPDLVVLSCGGTYDLLCERWLDEWRRNSGTPLRIIANFQVENPSLKEPDRRYLAQTFPTLDRAFFVSRRNLETTRRHLVADLPNATLLHNPLRCSASDRLPWPEANVMRLATISRLDVGKGVVLVLHALAHALGGEPGWQLDMFGQGPDEALIRSTIDALHLSERVSLRGYVGNLSDIWRDHHLLISPSIDDGVPMTIPEAMVLGRPVLATRVGAAEEWIQPHVNGFLCPAATIELLASSLTEVWDARGEWAQLGARASESSAAFYRPDDYNKIISRP